MKSPYFDAKNEFLRNRLPKPDYFTVFSFEFSAKLLLYSGVHMCASLSKTIY